MPVTSVPKSEDFLAWYNEIVELAELTDKRYPIKGMNIWRPYGQSIMSRIDGFTRKEMETAQIDEVNFPLMIPEQLFMKEADQIKGFGSEVFWVDRAGDNLLPDGERWVVRPTSECAMYEVFPLWIRSHADLPLKTYQICNVFRYETKQTRAFMRVREIHFFEEHSVFATEEAARAHVDVDLEIVGRVFDNLALSTIRTKRPDWDKFPGAVESNAADIIMPSGRVLQCATVHYYGTNFAEAYDMTYNCDPSVWKSMFESTVGCELHLGVPQALVILSDNSTADHNKVLERLVDTGRFDVDGEYAIHMDFVKDGVVYRLFSGDESRASDPNVKLVRIANNFWAIGHDKLAGTPRTASFELGGQKYIVPCRFNSRYCHQTTYGMSERLVGASIGCHGDDNGLILPPSIAPIQVVVVPIPFKDSHELVNAAAEEVVAELRAAGLRVELDARDRSPGDKYYHWELRGVPLRLEIGPKDVEKESVFSARRDIPGRDGKAPIQRSELVAGVEAKLAEIQEALFERQRAFASSRIVRLGTLDEALAHQKDSEGDHVYELPISGDEAAQEVEKAMNIKTLGVPVDADADATGEVCAVTGAPAATWLRFALTY